VTSRERDTIAAILACCCKAAGSGSPGSGSPGRGGPPSGPCCSCDDAVWQSLPLAEDGISRKLRATVEIVCAPNVGPCSFDIVGGINCDPNTGGGGFFRPTNPADLCGSGFNFRRLFVRGCNNPNDPGGFISGNFSTLAATGHPSDPFGFTLSCAGGRWFVTFHLVFPGTGPTPPGGDGVWRHIYGKLPVTLISCDPVVFARAEGTAACGEPFCVTSGPPDDYHCCSNSIYSVGCTVKIDFSE
jgi:hypothetical protein